jgi:hypothetical protein
MKYCTYITIYRGAKLPPFYIGHTTINKIQNGYHGSVKSKKYRKIWEREIEENPHLFETIIKTLHNTRQEAVDRETDFQKKLKVVQNPLYINGAIFPLMCDNTGRKLPLETRQRMSLAHRGKPRSALARAAISAGKLGKKFSEAHRKNLSQSHIGQVVSPETRAKISKNNGRRIWAERRKAVA